MQALKASRSKAKKAATTSQCHDEVRKLNQGFYRLRPRNTQLGDRREGLNDHDQLIADGDNGKLAQAGLVHVDVHHSQ